jgi:hypothetical protein
VGLNDVVLAPTFSKVPREQFKVRLLGRRQRSGMSLKRVAA